MAKASESGKRQLSREEEFQIMSLVLDKFLWLGFGIMTFGLYELYKGPSSSNGFYIMFAGAAILIVFIIILVREYELSKPKL